MGLIFNNHREAGAQNHAGSDDRRPAAAGRFYPADPHELRTMLKTMFSDAKPCENSQVLGIVCPHAGYVFSGTVAASGINQADPDKEYENVFVVGSSHYISLPGASIYNRGDYLTPLGKVKVNTTLADKLISEKPVFAFNPGADRAEHCIEVQIPFLQYHLKPGFKLVPIVIGTQSASTCRLIAEALKPYFNERNLFIFSTDFSHYPSWADARQADSATCKAIVSGKPDQLLHFLEEYRKKEVPDLSTNLCGWTSILTMLYMTSGDSLVRINPVHYMNSGDTGFGDKKQVVGYWSLAITRPFDFTQREKICLLDIARKTIEKYLRERRIPEPGPGLSANLTIRAGAFVTLKEHGQLRGCIGRFTSDQPLYQLISDLAIASATEDTRFEPVVPGETDSLEIEISVLSPLRKIRSVEEVALGKHGIYIRKGGNSGTFLPQVAVETGWTREEFLGHCARDKAGIGWNGWKDAELFVYEACVFSENEFTGRKD
ncbi:MAG: AmmeMemoRadiSam system protein B [Bacteroidota bacterium]